MVIVIALPNSRPETDGKWKLVDCCSRVFEERPFPSVDSDTSSPPYAFASPAVPFIVHRVHVP